MGPNPEHFSEKPLSAPNTEAERANGAFSEKPLSPLPDEDLPNPNQLVVEARHIARTKMSNLRDRGVSGANVFFVVAGVSMVAALASPGVPAIELGVTHFADANFPAQDRHFREGALGVTALVASILVVVGWFSRKGNLFAYSFGMVIYALDGMVMLGFLNLLSIFVHIAVIVRLWIGLGAFWEMHEIERDLGNLERELP